MISEIEKCIKLEKQNIPIIAIIIFCLPFVLGTIITGKIFLNSREMNILFSKIPYLLATFLIVSYVELNIGAQKLLIFLAIVYIIRLLSFFYNSKICSDKNSTCNPEDNQDPKYTSIYTSKGLDGITDVTETYYAHVENLGYDGLLFPFIAFTLVLIFMNTKNIIIKTLCIIFMISLYIFIFYCNKNISYKNINCSEKEKICYTFLSESLFYAVSLISAFIIMINF